MGVSYGLHGWAWDGGGVRLPGLPGVWGVGSDWWAGGYVVEDEEWRLIHVYKIVGRCKLSLSR